MVDNIPLLFKQEIDDIRRTYKNIFSIDIIENDAFHILFSIKSTGDLHIQLTISLSQLGYQVSDEHQESRNVEYFETFESLMFKIYPDIFKSIYQEALNAAF